MIRCSSALFKTWSVNKGLWNQSTEPSSIQQNSFDTSQDCPLYNKIGTWRRNCCQKRVGGLGPFCPALKNRHTLLFKSGTMWKPIKTRKFDVLCSHRGGLLTFRNEGWEFLKRRRMKWFFLHYFWTAILPNVCWQNGRFVSILSICFRGPCSILSTFLPWLFPSSSTFHSILFAVFFCKYIFSNTSVIKAKKIPRSSTATKETILLNEIGVSTFIESHLIDWSSVLHFLLCLWRAPVCLILL